MRHTILAALGILLLAGCASSKPVDNSGDLPLAVQSAFMAEYPYAKIDQTQHGKDPSGNELYVISYSNPDGTKATAFYGPSGEAKATTNLTN